MLVFVLGWLLLTLCMSAEAQQPGKAPRIGVLITASASDATRRVQGGLLSEYVGTKLA